MEKPGTEMQFSLRKLLGFALLATLLLGWQSSCNSRLLSNTKNPIFLFDDWQSVVLLLHKTIVLFLFVSNIDFNKRELRLNEHQRAYLLPQLFHVVFTILVVSVLHVVVIQSHLGAKDTILVDSVTKTESIFFGISRIITAGLFIFFAVKYRSKSSLSTINLFMVACVFIAKTYFYFLLFSNKNLDALSFESNYYIPFVVITCLLLLSLIIKNLESRDYLTVFAALAAMTLIFVDISYFSCSDVYRICCKGRELGTAAFGDFGFCDCGVSMCR